MTRARAGYSLFEVLVAFAVTAIVLAVLTSGQAGLLSRAAQGSTEALALDFAHSVLDETLHTHPFPPIIAQRSSGTFTAQIDLMQVQPVALAPALWQVEVRVYLRGSTEPLVQLSGLRAEP